MGRAIALKLRNSGKQVMIISSKEEENKRLKANRDYFESGCLCIKNKVIEKRPVNENDRLAVKYYENNCQCSRNYIGRHDYGND